MGRPGRIIARIDYFRYAARRGRAGYFIGESGLGYLFVFVLRSLQNKNKLRESKDNEDAEQY